MAKEILAGSTNQTIDVFIQDSSSTVGGGLAGLTFETASLTCYYRIGATGSWTALTLATQTIGGAHSDGGFVEGDATNAKGMYRLDLPDALFTNPALVKVYLQGAANMAPTVVEIDVKAAPNDISVANILAAAVEGSTTVQDALARMSAYAAGKLGVVDNEDGTFTLTYYGDDDTTAIYALTATPADGTRVQA